MPYSNRQNSKKRTLIACLLMFSIVSAGCQGGASGGTASPSGNGGTTAPPASSTEPANTSQEPQQTKPAEPPAAKPANVSMGKVTAVRLADAQQGWAGGDGWIAGTNDGGSHWNVQYTGTGTIRQIFALNGQDAWAVVADSSNLLSTSDGGKHWTAAGKVPNNAFLHFVSKTEAYSGNSKTTDGGKSWTTLPIPDHTVGDAYFHDAANGWAVTQAKDAIEVKRTKDGGKSWTTVMSKKYAGSLNGALIRSAGTDDAWIECIGDSGMTQTSYSLFHTEDGGKQWQTVIANSTAGGGPAPGFPSDYTGGPKNTGAGPGALYVVNPKVAYMGGVCNACDKPNTIGWTTDGGKTWVNGDAAFEGYGTQQLAIADEKHGWWICTDNAAPSVMYTTSDGGKHWNKVHTFDKPDSKK